MHMGIRERNESHSAHARCSSRRGFTLVELMIAVAIIGVLSTLAIVGYRKVITRARLGEATSMLAGIATAQERYRGEVGTYVNASTTLGHKGNQGSLCPTPSPATKKPWAPASCTGGANWTALAVQNQGTLYYGYSTTAGLAGVVPADAVAITAGTVTWPASTSLTRDWYVITAAADTDGDGSWTTVMNASWSNTNLVDDAD